MKPSTHVVRRVTPTVAGLLASVCMIAAPAMSGADEGHHVRDHRHVAAHAGKKRALHDAMRVLWEQHVAWTRLAIVSFAADGPDLAATEQRLLRNQVDIGNAIKPYYGRAAGEQLTVLLKEHITGAVALLQAAKGGDAGAIADAKAAWYANGKEVADFLNAANPRHWPRGEMRSMMRKHLDQTLDEAVAQLTGDYGASIREYDAIERHILAMADTLSRGIVKQFPRRFR
jgi:hypothetical protein